MSRRISFPLGEEGLERLAALPKLVGLREGGASWEVARETFFDTGDGALRARRMVLKLRVDGGGRETVELARVHAVNLEGVVEESTVVEPVVGGGLYATLAGTSEIATRVRDVAEPAALGPVAALDVDREVRDLRPGLIGRPTLRATFDRIVGHVPGATQAFHELSLTELRPGKPGLEAVAERLRASFGIVNDGLDTLERVRTALGTQPPDPEATARLDGVAGPRVALILMCGGAVALEEGSHGLVLPHAEGSGEDGARALCGDLLPGPGGPELDLIGFAPSSGGGGDVELWLHERLAAGTKMEGLTMVPFRELLARLGGPRLRDPSLAAGLRVLVRSETGMRLLREAPPAGPTPRFLPSPPRAAGAEPGREEGDLLDPELSILDFNQRVLEMAEDPEVPLLERFRFLSIVSSNLDEFFVVRVGRLKVEAGLATAADESLMSAAHLLDVIAVRIRALAARQYACLFGDLLPALAARGVSLRRWEELDEEQRAVLAGTFEREIFPLLTPRALTSSPGQPFPRLISLGHSLAAVLADPEEARPHLAHVRIPAELPSFLPVPGGGRDLIPVEEVVVANAASLFPAFRLLEAHAFRVSRLGDVKIDEDASSSLLAAVEDELESRPYKPVVRIEVQRTMPREVRAHLLRELRSERGTDSAVLSRGDIYEVDGPIDLSSFAELASLDLSGARYPDFHAAEPLAAGDDIFDVLARRDVLAHHPYDSFETTVLRFLRAAAGDPGVVSIKLTLYRTGRDSPVVDALLEALANGKDVSVFVELKARFDEESNVEWTHRLTEAGGHVVYGLVGFKTHAKTALVVRREGDGELRRYVHVGTGNYNAATSRFYTDLGLMSSDPDLGADVHDFFNELTGSSGPPVKEHRLLWVAPNTLVRKVLEAVDREIEHAQAGRPARIQAKLNGLSDKKVVRRLYAASAAGVEIDLVVRGICSLRPGVPGLSERIRVRSVLGRFLEHSRVYAFENGGEWEYYIGSADWRARNLRRRVEVVAPVLDRDARARLRDLIDADLSDPRAWVLRSDGAYQREAGAGRTAQELHMQATAPAER